VLSDFRLSVERQPYGGNYFVVTSAAQFALNFGHCATVALAAESRRSR
jgi:hypothetical protein